jgi:hypothetical protein
MKSSGKGKRKKKPESSTLNEIPWKTIFVILCLALIVLTAFQIFVITLDPMAGWDYYVYVGAIKSLDHMQNPYILENINQYVAGNTGGNLPFTYPPHTLYFFWILNIFFVFQNIGIYYALLFILLIASGYLIVTIDTKPHYLFLTTLLLTGFMGMVWNLGTGNKDIFFLFLFALIFVLLVKEKYWQSSIVMGLAAAVSLITAPFVAVYLVVRRPSLNRLAYIFLSGVVVAVLILISYCLNPTYFVSYINTLQGGSTSPLFDIGGMNTPTPYLMFADLLKGVNFNGILPVAIVSCVYVGLILYASWNYFEKNSLDSLKIYSLIIFAVFMMLPRIKPYDFIILVLPLYFLFKDCSYRMKCLMFAVISLPIFCWYLNFIIYTHDFPFLLGIYTQTYSLILIFVVIILHNYLTPASRQAGNDQESS